MQSLKEFITEAALLKNIDIKSLYIDELSKKALIDIISNKKNIEVFAKSEDPFSNSSMYIRKDFHIKSGDGYVGLILLKNDQVYLRVYFPTFRGVCSSDVLLSKFLQKGYADYIDGYDDDYEAKFSEKDRIEVLRSILKQYQYNVIGKIITSHIPKEYEKNNDGSIIPKTKKELQQIIKDTITREGNTCDLNFIDTSKINDMSLLFFRSDFNGDISKWDVSNVTNMRSMFNDSQFNGDISKWNVSKVKNMKQMFKFSKFDGDISKWNTSNVKDMEGMFESSVFNQDISKWDVSNVTTIGDMFYMSKAFNQDISKWDVSNVTDMRGTFFCAKAFNQDISKWDVSNVTDMGSMFVGSQFNQDISKWDVSNVKEINDMFDHCPIKDKYKPKFK